MFSFWFTIKLYDRTLKEIVSFVCKTSKKQIYIPGGLTGL